MSLENHTDKIVFIKDYFLSTKDEYLVVYGAGSCGKFHIVQQAYNILDEDTKNLLYVTIIRNDSPQTYGNKTSPRKKNVIIREELDEISTMYINNWNAKVVQFLPDPVHLLHAIRNNDVALRKLLRSITANSTDVGSPVLDLIPLRYEYINIDYENSNFNTVIYKYGLKNETVIVKFNEGGIQFGEFSKIYS